VACRALRGEGRQVGGAGGNPLQVLVGLAGTGDAPAVVEAQSARGGDQGGQGAEVGVAQCRALVFEAAGDDQQVALDDRELVQHDQVVGAERGDGERRFGGEKRVEVRPAAGHGVDPGAVLQGQGGNPAHREVRYAVALDRGLLGADRLQCAACEGAGDRAVGVLEKVGREIAGMLRSGNGRRQWCAGRQGVAGHAKGWQGTMGAF